MINTEIISKVKKTIQSCETSIQLQGAKRYLDNLLRLNSTYNIKKDEYETPEYIWDEYEELLELCISQGKMLLNQTP